jgi:hypothetical protein
VLEAVFEQRGFGFTNDGKSFTGCPVMGYQHRIQGLFGFASLVSLSA